ncbi:hypothetical protein Tco_0349717 [Tanacetum coccineum]
MALPPRDQRHQYLRFMGLDYTDANITDFEERLELMDKGLSGRMLKEYMDAQRQEAVLDLDTTGALQFQLGGVRRRMSLRGFILGMGLHTAEEIESVGFDAY